ncbi:hypothetical protein J2848_003754 [Azospirillum lipoferum]|nr:hypothetical protein [Azospirillum lipoferum]
MNAAVRTFLTAYKQGKHAGSEATLAQAETILGIKK